MRTPRKLKKAVRKSKVIMDVASMPLKHGIDFDKWLYTYHNCGIALYSKENGGDAPRITPHNKRLKIVNYETSRSI